MFKYIILFSVILLSTGCSSIANKMGYVSDDQYMYNTCIESNNSKEDCNKKQEAFFKQRKAK